MRVALVIDTLDGGGAERIVCELAQGLARRGHGAFVYCLRDAGAPAEELRTAGVTVRVARSFGRDLTLPLRLTAWLRRDRIDVANTQSSAATVMAFPGAKLLGVPLLQTRQGLLLERPTRHQRVVDRAARWLDGIGVVSESLRETLPPGRPRARAFFLPNSVDRSPESPETARAALEKLTGPLTGPVILTVGTICPEKAPATLLRALALLRRRVPDLRLVWIGGVRGAAHFAEVQRLQHELGLDECVCWTGPREHAWQFMAGADVFCLPSRTEATPVAAVEALSQRVPIVATTVGGVGRLGPEGDAPHYLLRHARTALLVPPGDPAALAAALEQTRADPAAAARRAARGFETYRSGHTADCLLDRYLAAFDRLLRGKRRPRPGRAFRTAPSRWPTSARPGVVLVGPGPEQTGGIAAAIDGLMCGPLAAQWPLRRFATTRSSLPPRASPWRRLLDGVRRHVGALVGLWRAARRPDVGLVHLHTCSSFTFYRNVLDLLVARAAGRRVVWHIHGGAFDAFVARAGRIGTYVIRHGLRATDAIVVLSSDWCDRLRPLAPAARFHVVPNAFDEQLAADVERCRAEREPPADVTPRPPRLLYLGPLVAPKGVGELLDAAAGLRRRGYPFELRLAGPASVEQLRTWSARLHELGLTDVVQLWPTVRGSSKTELLAAADVFVLPSHVEGLPLTVLDAAAIGLPVVATTVGALPEICGIDQPGSPLAELVPPRDSAALAEALAGVLSDLPAARARAARHAAFVRARYSPNLVAERLNWLYAALLGVAPTQTHAMPPRAPRQYTPLTPSTAASAPSNSSFGSTGVSAARTVVTQPSGVAT
jgi:glycosyltransferase involved in cell wall biosynthesis